MTAADRVLPLLSGVRSRGQNRWLALCPAHPDKHPSLSILHAGDRLLLKCWTTCTVAAIVAALGLTLADLFDDQRQQTKPDPFAQRKRRALAGLEIWRQAEIRRCAEGLRTRDAIIRAIDATVSEGAMTVDEAWISLGFELEGYNDLQCRFDRLLRNQDTLELWRESRRGL
jgi:hypothetical protein